MDESARDAVVKAAAAQTKIANGLETKYGPLRDALLRVELWAEAEICNKAIRECYLLSKEVVSQLTPLVADDPQLTPGVEGTPPEPHHNAGLKATSNAAITEAIKLYYRTLAEMLRARGKGEFARTCDHHISQGEVMDPALLQSMEKFVTGVGEDDGTSTSDKEANPGIGRTTKTPSGEQVTDASARGGPNPVNSTPQKRPTVADETEAVIAADSSSMVSVITLPS